MSERKELVENVINFVSEQRGKFPGMRTRATLRSSLSYGDAASAIDRGVRSAGGGLSARRAGEVGKTREYRRRFDPSYKGNLPGGKHDYDFIGQREREAGRRMAAGGYGGPRAQRNARAAGAPRADAFKGLDRQQSLDKAADIMKGIEAKYPKGGTPQKRSAPGGGSTKRNVNYDSSLHASGAPTAYRKALRAGNVTPEMRSAEKARRAGVRSNRMSGNRGTQSTGTPSNIPHLLARPTP